MEWIKHEHEEKDITTLNHPNAIHALINCSLHKIFTISSMKAQLDLLELMVRKSNVQEKCFIIGEHMLVIDVDYIYFLFGFHVAGW